MGGEGVDPEAAIQSFFPGKVDILLLWVSILCCQINGFFFFFPPPHCVAYGLLVPWPVIKPETPAVEAQSLNHWTTREVPRLHTFFWFWPYCTTCVILVPQTEIKPGPLAVGEQSPNHWTARGFPKQPFQSRALPPLAVPKAEAIVTEHYRWVTSMQMHSWKYQKEDREAQSGPSHFCVDLAKSFNPSEFWSLI